MANRLPVSNQRLPEILDGWHLPGGSQPEISFLEETQGTPDQHVETEAGITEGIRHTAPGESVLVKLLAAWAARMRKAKNAGPAESVPFWSTWKPEPERLGPEKCMQLRARSLKSSLEPEHCKRGKHTCCERGQTQCGRNTASAPHTRPWPLSAVPLPPCSMTEPKQETTSAHLCQGWN